MATIGVATSFASSQIQQPFEDAEQRERRRRILTIVVGATAGASLFTALVAMYVEASVAAYLAFCFPLVMAPYSVHQRRQLNKMPTFVDEINRCRETVNRLACQNLVLHKENNKLELQVQKLATTEQRLQQTAQQNHTSVHELETLIRDYGRVQRQMKKLQQARELQTLLTTILKSDSNQNDEFSDAELDQLMIRLRAFASSSSIILFDEDKLREAFRASGAHSATSIYQVTSSMCSTTNEEDGDSVVKESEKTSFFSPFEYSQCID